MKRVLRVDHSLPGDHRARMAKAMLSVEGLSTGDAFGQRFFYPAEDLAVMVSSRKLPPAPWRYTDDTEMSLAILQVLDGRGRIVQDELAETFARRYQKDPGRGYGGYALDLLDALLEGKPWQEISPTVYHGEGSMGNGAAMRAAPVGAYFFGDLKAVIEEVRASAEVTHFHPEGQAGAIAVAVAAAHAGRFGSEDVDTAGKLLLEAAEGHTPDGETRTGLQKALQLSFDASVEEAVSLLGNGSRITAPDTVPFTLWCAARHINNYADAMWATVAGSGDMDTNCAIVGGIVALAVGAEGLPEKWINSREPLKSD